MKHFTKSLVAASPVAEDDLVMVHGRSTGMAPKAMVGVDIL